MDPIEVRVGDCTHPDDPHEEGDVVYLSPTLPAPGGIAAEQLIGDVFGDELTNRWLVIFVRHGVTGANYEPFSVDDLLADWARARPVAIRAGELYLASVTAPFLTEQQKRSPTGRTRATTSRRPSPTPSPSE
jgi:hypothetical protein